MLHHGHVYFELCQDGGVEACRRRGSVDAHSGAWAHDDRVLSRGVNDDQRHSARAVDHLHPRRIDTRVLQGGDKFAARGVVAHGADHVNLGAQAGCSDRLVRALTPWLTLEVATQDRLTRARGGAYRSHKVKVDRAKNRESGRHH